jgi:hypothetical protein
MSDLASSNRRYLFRKYGRSDCYWHWQRRQQDRRDRLGGRQRHGRDVYRAVHGQQPDFERIINHENLLVVYDRLRVEGGQAPGIDGLTYRDFSRSEIARVLQAASQAILQRHYRPYPTRLVRVPKGDGRYRELRLPVIVDRAIAKAVTEAVAVMLDPTFLPSVYGFRARNCPGRPSLGIWDLLLALERTAIEQDRWVFAIDDIKDAFPSVRIDDAMGDYRCHTGSDNLLWLIETVLRGDEGQNRTKGIDQGNALAPVTFNLRAHYALDLPQSASRTPTDAAGPGNPPWYRWADNLIYLCQSVTKGNQALQRARELLQAAGFALKGEDGPPAPP